MSHTVSRLKGAMMLWAMMWIAASFLFTALAQAADQAEHRILGFSPNADIFAFEEFGVQDGSGFAYANIYFLDTRTDSWLPDTPIRVMIDDMDLVGHGMEHVGVARDAAMDKARPRIEEHAIDDVWVTLAHSPLAEFESSPIALAFGIQPRWSALADIEDRFQAELDLYYADSPGQDCIVYMGDRPMGLRLKIRNLESGNEAVLHEDEAIPRSRGCPISYRLSRVVTPDQWPVEQVVVLISVLRHGYEGADRRYIAVSGRLPE